MSAPGRRRRVSMRQLCVSRSPAFVAKRPARRSRSAAHAVERNLPLRPIVARRPSMEVPSPGIRVQNHRDGADTIRNDRESDRQPSRCSLNSPLRPSVEVRTHRRGRRCPRVMTADQRSRPPTRCVPDSARYTATHQSAQSRAECRKSPRDRRQLLLVWASLGSGRRAACGIRLRCRVSCIHPFSTIAALQASPFRGRRPATGRPQTAGADRR